MTASRRDTLASSAAIGGSLAIGIGSLVAAIPYAGTRGEPYSLLNHFVSELGQVGVSTLAPLFNVALVIGGIGYAVFMLGLGLAHPTRYRWGFMPFGVIAGISGMFVGIFPMNNLPPHALSASVFFNLGWISVGLASVSFWRHPDRRFDRRLSLLGALTVACFFAFLGILRVDPIIASTGFAVPDERPLVWPVPALEWAVLIGILAWTLLAGISWRRARAAR